MTETRRRPIVVIPDSSFGLLKSSTASREIYGLTLDQVDDLVKTSRLEQGVAETLSVDQLERIATVTRATDRAAS